MICTSPPYFGLRSYLPNGHEDKAKEIGLEQTPDAYVAEMVAVFREARRVLRDDGTLWLNIGDSYASPPAGNKTPSGISQNTAKRLTTELQAFNTQRKWWGAAKPKDLLMIPARVALALQADGWYLRSEIIWAKPNPMPESVQGSHFSRHMVTISDYERLSGLSYADERAGEDWAGDMPSMSEIEVPRSKAPLSAKRQGTSHSARQGGTRGRQREEETGGGDGCRESEPREICEDRERKSNGESRRCSIPSDREWQAQERGTALGDKGLTGADCAEAARQRYLCQDAENGCEEASRLCEAESGARSRDAFHGRDVARSSGATQEPLSLLQEEASSNARSHNPNQQGGIAHRGEHRSGVRKLQFEKGKPDRSSLLVGCPGCDVCAKHHGYILHLSAGRPTCAHEKVYLFAKQPRYFFDNEAVKELSITPGSVHVAKLGQKNEFTKREIPKHNIVSKATRNMRNVWTIATEPSGLEHFAIMPTALAEICIKAGTSEKGCCPHCGAGWVRQIEKERIAPAPPSGNREIRSWTGGESQLGGHMIAREMGWQPSCDCPEHEPVPATVLDFFGGVGTTGLVADRLGRNAVLIELHPQNIEMAADRVRQDAGLFAEISAA